ncbi:hypothetical protein K491DRAFT_695143 [Lophiostoma macrostomum CBS 122681]|uniref:Uncharacterized protein n=1 Tax=Lophiostoma macrostomum CBS 122681 TaxID=1314788 RepID=A0A6A6T2D6_9PLEO|nr:hypothetical protein K491DRAFT_695143 [Lophiostoma macrostomum CBS 122681]
MERDCSAQAAVVQIPVSVIRRVAITQHHWKCRHREEKPHWDTSFLTALPLAELPRRLLVVSREQHLRPWEAVPLVASQSLGLEALSQDHNACSVLSIFLQQILREQRFRLDSAPRPQGDGSSATVWFLDATHSHGGSVRGQSLRFLSSSHSSSTRVNVVETDVGVEMLH